MVNVIESLHICIIIIILDSIFIFREAQSSGCLESAQSRFHLPPFQRRHRNATCFCIHSGDVGGRFVDSPIRRGIVWRVSYDNKNYPSLKAMFKQTLDIQIPPEVRCFT